MVLLSGLSGRVCLRHQHKLFSTSHVCRAAAGTPYEKITVGELLVVGSELLKVSY